MCKLDTRCSAAILSNNCKVIFLSFCCWRTNYVAWLDFVPFLKWLNKYSKGSSCWFCSSPMIYWISDKTYHALQVLDLRWPVQFWFSVAALFWSGYDKPSPKIFISFSKTFSLSSLYNVFILLSGWQVCSLSLPKWCLVGQIKLQNVSQ